MTDGESKKFFLVLDVEKLCCITKKWREKFSRRVRAIPCLLLLLLFGCVWISHIYIYISTYIYIDIYIEGFRVCRTSFSLSACGNNSTTKGWMAAGKKRGWLVLFDFCIFVFILKVYIMHTHWFVRKEKKTLLFFVFKESRGVWSVDWFDPCFTDG